MPDFLIVGAQRCGTTWLYRQLSEHTEVTPPFKHKETHYFDRWYDFGDAWYERNFPQVDSLTFEATPCYIYYPDCADRIANYNPSIKSIILLRDPVERAWSHYCHEVTIGREHLSFVSAIRRESERVGTFTRYTVASDHFGYVRRGMYGKQLHYWFNHFDRSQCLVVDSHRMFSHPRDVLKDVAAFLGIANQWQDDQMQQQPHNDRIIPDGIVSELRARFAEDQSYLRDLLNEQRPTEERYR